MKQKITRISAVVLWVMGGFLVLVGVFFGEWARAAQGALFIALGVYFWRWKPEA
ncbi:MAG: hypothetical protein GXO36_04330 [Chloroflexi bacterium]|nr:hypothetical protein [Chloroflexota bacterium]